MEENLEQPKTEGSNQFGKFKDAESLMKAYSNLEAEFTKKSQKLAMLETENEQKEIINTKKAEQFKEIENLASKFEILKPFSGALKESLSSSENVDIKEEAIRLISTSYKTAEEYSCDGEFLNNYIFSSTAIKDKIIKDYLEKLTQNSPIKVERGSKSISLTPPNIPLTIKEAGDMAKSIIKQK